MTTRELVNLITGGKVPVYQDSLAFCKGGGFYHWNPECKGQEFVCLGYDTSTDGKWLAVAAHEAFHAMRHLQGVEFYNKVAGELTPKDWAVEELCVNKAARDYLMPLLDEDEQWYAENTFDDIDIEYRRVLQ